MELQLVAYGIRQRRYEINAKLYVINMKCWMSWLDSRYARHLPPPYACEQTSALWQMSEPEFWRSQNLSRIQCHLITTKKDTNLEGVAGFSPYGRTFEHALCLQADNGFIQKSEPEFWRSQNLLRIQCHPITTKKHPHFSGCFFVVGVAGFGPAKSLTTDLQSAPFGRSGTLPYKIVARIGAGERSRTINLLITNQLLCHWATPAYYSCNGDIIALHL